MPIAGSVALDTNIAVLFLAGDREIRRCVAESEFILITTIFLGELFYGASRSARLQSNFRRIEEFANSVEVVNVTIETARHFGSIKSLLSRNGTPIPNNDIWIAAAGREYDVAIATRDQHFNYVDGIQVVNW
jgi:tRNA(fMet)-specific endonuclease VapC